ncbi:MAG TPA: O-antigen ligase family protein [Bacteroidia bacterium]|nr:O-antigen ligase family protein [Bacteroidia bacterium]
MSKKAIAPKIDTTAIFIFLAFLFPIIYLIYVNSLFDPTNVPRFLFSSLVFIGGIWLLKDTIQKKTEVNFITILLLSFYLWSALSLLWAFNFGEAVFQIQKHFLIVLTIIIFSNLIRKNAALPVYISRALVCLVPLILLVFLKQITTTLQTESLGEYTMYKIPGLSAHKNLQSGFLFFLSSFFILGYFRDESAWKKFYLPSFTVVFTIILILQTRAVYVAILAFLLTFIFSAFYIKFHTKKSVLFDGWKKIGVAILISFSIFVGFYAAFSKTKKVVEQSNPANYMNSVSANERMVLWYYSAKMFKHNPVLGVGAGNWKVRFPEGGLRELYRGQNENLVFLQPHNDYIWIACETGIVGLLLFIVPLFLIFLNGLNSLKNLSEKDKITMMILLSAIAGWGAISMFDFPKERAELFILSGTLFGIVFGLSKRANEKIFFTISDKPFKILITSLLVLNVIIGINRISSESHVMAMNTYRNNQNHEMAIKEAQKAQNFFININTLTVPFDFYIGEAYAAQQKTELSIEYFERAYEINPFLYSGLNNLAAAYMKTKQYEKALPLFLKAQFIYPKLEDGMLNLCYTYTMLKQYDEAEKWALKVEKNTRKKDIFLRKIEEAKQADLK